MGGYPLAMRLAEKQQAGLFAGLIVSSMLGCTLVFSIPVGLGLSENKDRPFFVKGLLIGLITIPFGSMAGGIVARFDLNLILVNSIPTIFLALCLILGLINIPNRMVAGALIFGRFIVIVITIGLAAAAFQEVTKKVLIPGMAPIMHGIIVTGQIAVVLRGTFPWTSRLRMSQDVRHGCHGSRRNRDHFGQQHSCLQNDEGKESEE
jgi:ethanolamine transporter